MPRTVRRSGVIARLNVAFALEHTPGHVDCPGCRPRSLRRTEVALQDMLFRAAFDRWLDARILQCREETSVRYISEDSEKTYREYGTALDKFFAELRLCEIHDGHLRVYQEWRAENHGGLWTKPAAQNRIRKEVQMCIRLLKAAGLWGEDMKSAFAQLPVQGTELQRVLEPSEEARFLEVLGSKQKWHWVRDYAVLALQTCASTKELRMIRLGDINLHHMTLRVGPKASKNKFRNRTIPLETDEAVHAVMNLMHRARRLGATEPEHFLFPYGGRDTKARWLDPGKPMTKHGVKSNWLVARKDAGVPWLRPYDLRHTAITRMAEKGIPIAVIMAFAGHISQKMQQHYTTISMQAKRIAANKAFAVAAKKPPASVPHASEQNSIPSFPQRVA